jgi:hypothetical protein
MKRLTPEEVVEAIARLPHDEKMLFANIFVNKWTTLAKDVSSMVNWELQEKSSNGV